MASLDHFGQVLWFYHVVGNYRDIQDFIVLLVYLLTGSAGYAVTQDREQVKYEMWQCKPCCFASRLSAACSEETLPSAGRSGWVLCFLFSPCYIS